MWKTLWDKQSGFFDKQIAKKKEKEATDEKRLTVEYHTKTL